MSVTIYKAIDLILQNSFFQKSEIVPLEYSSSRVCAETLYASLALPLFDNSAMDGYAIKGESEHYKVKGKILAGDSSELILADTEAIKIMTGAKLPAGTQSIVPQECVTRLHDNIKIDQCVKPGAHIRKKGEDINIGEVVLQNGQKITSALIALLASQGITHVKVFKKPRIAIFASGAELKLHYEKLQDSQIYNSNTPYLLSRCNELGCESLFVGKAKDDLDSIREFIRSSLDCDLIITSGGVSVGEADFTKEAFEAEGFECGFCKVDIKPGKPTTFGKIKDTFILNLPGNPLALSLNFEIFGKLIINKLCGLKAYHHSFLRAKMAKEFIKTKKIDTVIPGFYDGSYYHVAKQYSPGMVNVLNHCNGFIIISKDKEKINQNETVKFLPIEWNFGSEEFKEFIT